MDFFHKNFQIGPYLFYSLSLPPSSWPLTLIQKMGPQDQLTPWAAHGAWGSTRMAIGKEQWNGQVQQHQS